MMGNMSVSAAGRRERMKRLTDRKRVLRGWVSPGAGLTHKSLSCMSRRRAPRREGTVIKESCLPET